MDWKKLSTSKSIKVYNRSKIKQCYLCGAKSQTSLCSYCTKGFLKNTRHCKICALPVSPEHIEKCGECQKSPPLYHQCIAPLIFEGITKHLIHSIKFKQKNHYISPLIQIVSNHLLTTYRGENWPTQLIYVPSHSSRIRERGFCQTQLLARLLTSQLGSQLNTPPVLPKRNPIAKITNTDARHTLTRKQRISNHANHYQVTHSVDEHVALLDDVMTTGSTVQSCTQQLLEAGAKRVDVWVIARTAKL